MIWNIRWRIASALVSAAMRIAPKSAARGLLIAYLNAFRAEVLDAVAKHKEAQSDG